VLPTASVPRERVDRCPGVLRLIEAADGYLARIRLPGGLIDSRGLHALAGISGRLGDGRLELTSRGNVQLRGLRGDAGLELGAGLAAAGLWPSESHELVRNIVASPLAGIDHGPDRSEIVHELDRRLCQDPALTELSGRFLFAIDDGRGDVAALKPDALAVIDSDTAWVEGRTVRSGAVATALLGVAHAFLDERAAQHSTAQRSTAWRVDELTDGRARVRARIGGGESRLEPAAPRAPIGRIDQGDGRAALVLAPPLGRLTLDQSRWIAEHQRDRPARITPWRSVVLPDLADVETAQREANALGLVTTSDSPWFAVSACAGRPRCAQARADVQLDAAAALGRWPGQRVHWSGCERQCGRPLDTDIDVIATATANGYTITGTDTITGTGGNDSGV
jgi:precorrin-3B synthase